MPNNSALFVKAEPPTSSGSWWLGLDRPAFYQAVAHHDVTRFRLQSKNVGSFQTSGPMRASRPNYDRPQSDEY